MNLFVPDTHAVYWYEFGDPKLSANAEQVFKDAEAGSSQLVLQPIVIAEFHWLLRKMGLQSQFTPCLGFVQRNPAYRFEPIILPDLGRPGDFDEIPEMHDRLIAIIAERLGATIVTCDRSIQGCHQVKCVW